MTTSTKDYRSDARKGQAPSPGAIPADRAIAKTRDLALALLCFLPPLYVASDLPTFHTLTDNKWLLVVFLSICSVFLIVLAEALNPMRPKGTHPPLGRAMLVGAAALGTAYLLSAVLSRQPGFSIRAAIPALALIALFAAIVRHGPSAVAAKKFAILIVATGSLVGACALLQHAGFDPLARLVRYREADRYRTGVFVTLGNPEYLGGYLAPLALVAAGLAFGARGWRSRAVALAAIALTAVPALLSGSRGAFLGLVAGAVVLVTGVVFVASGRSRKLRLAALAAGGGVIVLIAASVLWNPQGREGGLLRMRLRNVANPYARSIRHRIVFNLVGLEMVAGRPVVGVGPGMYGLDFYPAFFDLSRRGGRVAMEVIAREFNGTVPEHTHNDWLEIWAETGTLGLAAWLWVLATWFVAIGVGLRNRGTADRMLLLALAAATIALLVNALFNFPLHEPVRATLFWLLLALSGSLGASAAGRPARGG